AILEPGPGSSAWPRLREAGLPEGDGALIVRRVLARNGGGRNFLDGALATPPQLADVGGRLFDRASEHENQSVGVGRTHLAALDAFGRLGALRATMASAWTELAEAEASQSAAELDARTRAEREDFLRFQLDQIGAVAPREGEDVTLARERERLRAAER